MGPIFRLTLNILRISIATGTVIPGNLRLNFLRHFLHEPYFKYDSHRKDNV